jgi:hypothetical protein
MHLLPGISKVKSGTEPAQRRSYWSYCVETNVHPNQQWYAFTVIENDLCCPLGTEIAVYSVGLVFKPKPDELSLELRIGTSKYDTTASVCIISSSLIANLFFRLRSPSYWHLHLSKYAF